ncbi:putative pyridoxal kinase C6F6.11c [Daldinia childiae]|uniref:putative pyridoxal kinase C6F6.11c n=1 Tax=Daldinia childiae TaxID=326645 RepID=UPI001447F1D4|nr:putative pyridoxal kinase C6F6.11c [Daldinia childiae]KAF3055718.1 putative pyridoxal kinase C6F6.11c [Daldinia childiae]
MSAEPPFVPETSVLAVASHVVSGNVGNKIAVFALQSMGCDVSAMNTVQFSNHTGYKQWKGTRVSAQEITDLWEGLKQSYLDNFDMMLSGYVPGAAAVEAVGNIGKELKHKSKAQKPGSFFWVLDPVMGDNGRLYVAEDVVPAYKNLIQYADLILPNQFEAELLSGVKITDFASLENAIRVLHQDFGVPHIVITSVSLPSANSSPSTETTRTMSVVGSTMTSDRQPRLFRITFPVFECYFSGTGDMFAALMVARMREAVTNYDKQSNGDGNGPLVEKLSWLSPDDADAQDLPLARAAEKVLASMHEVLDRTCASLTAEMAEKQKDKNLDEKALHLIKSRASELKLARNLGSLRNPKVEYRAEKV